VQVQSLAIPDVKILTPKRYSDPRGFFSEVYNSRLFAEAGINETFVQDNQSLSGQIYTLRGLHFQKPPHAQAKLVRVVRGRILDVAVDLRRGSPTYGHHVSTELLAENWRQLLVPVGFAHAFLTLEPNTEVIYKVTDYYVPDCDAGVLWSDPDLAINWPAPAGQIVLSDRDGKLPLLKDLAAVF
jgi:dTDP-4-dehydrorhamnose 3,5-epimerase